MDRTPLTLTQMVRGFPRAMRNLPRAFALYWEADRPAAIFAIFHTAVAAGMPLASAWVAKMIIDNVIRTAGMHLTMREGLRELFPYLAIEFALVLYNLVSNNIRRILAELTELKLDYLITSRIVRKALSLEMSKFEEAEFYDKMQKARKNSESRVISTVGNTLDLGRSALTLVSVLAVLLAYNPWIGLLLFVSSLPAFLMQSRFRQVQFSLQSWRAPETRMVSYLEHLLTVDTSVKEVKLFQLGEPLLKRYSTIFMKRYHEDRLLAWKQTGWGFFFALIARGTNYSLFAWVIGTAIIGRISIGSMSMYITLFRQSRNSFDELLASITGLYSDGLFLEDLVDFLGYESPRKRLDPATRPAEDPTRGIELQDVWYQYPGRTEWGVQGITLTIGPGEKVALVGENGAGKTTLIKLITGLIEPTRGRVLFRGVDLRYLEPEELHRRVGAIFQDFVHFQLKLRENIGFGSIDEVDDLERVKVAAACGGADQVAAELPNSYESVLGRWFEGGQEISGGQWQKVAIARAFMKRSELIILDEPTSALDAAAEYEVFKQFRSLTEDRMALVVSHRFSTVRMADKIAVLDSGRVEELGSHAELVASGKSYARLFELQAQGYR